MYRIGVIGFGFVGNAITYGFSHYTDSLLIYDKCYPETNSLAEVVEGSDYIFLCLPTPMNDEGKQNLSIMDTMVEQIVSLARQRKIIIIKSTVLPGTARSYAEKYPEVTFISSPEFLTEKSARLDFINQSRIIIGSENGEAADFGALETFKLYRLRFKHTPIFFTTYEGAELIKYVANTFFAMKLSYLNEVYDICISLGIEYELLRDMFLSDGRIGNSHSDVPGYDGYRGYGGKCFPKDVKGFVKWAEENGHKLELAKITDFVNERIRINKDWKNIEGVINNE